MLNSFSWPDVLVIVAYALLLVVSGLLLNRKEQTTTGFFLGSRQMPVWAVAISVLATSQSAATFLGGPDQGYRGDLSYLTTNLAAFIAAGVVAAVLYPAFISIRYTLFMNCWPSGLHRPVNIRPPCCIWAVGSLPVAPVYIWQRWLWPCCYLVISARPAF